MIDTRLFFYIVWGIGTTLVYGFVMDGSYRAYLRTPDRRSRREFMASIALFLTALAANLAILMVLFGEPGTSVRSFLIALALGAFAAAGVVMLTNRAEQRKP